MKVLVKALFTFTLGQPSWGPAGSASAEQEIDMPHIPETHHYIKMEVGGIPMDLAFQIVTWNAISQQFEVGVKGEARSLEDRERLRQDKSWRNIQFQDSTSG